MPRRRFLSAAGASAAAPQFGVFDFAASVMAGQSPTPSKPLIRVAVVRPKDQKGYWMTFTGPGYDAPARMAEFTQIMSDAARQLDARLEIHAAPVCDQAAADGFLAECEKSPPDGILLVLMCGLYWPGWEIMNHLVAKRGQVPTILFAPAGTTFTGQHAKTRNTPLTFQAATQDANWLADGVRMLATIGKMKRARVCILTGTKSDETQVPGLGITLRRLPLARWMDEFHKASTTDEVRAIADFYTKAAKNIREPKPADILDAAKFYVVARKIMAAENCQGISVDCMPLIGKPGVPCGPCLAWSKLNDELVVGACEADVNAICSLMLCHSLLRRPGFMQDPVPNTINNTLIGAHCSCPTKLAGSGQPPAPLVLRSDNGTNYGCATQVLWPWSPFPARCSPAWGWSFAADRPSATRASLGWPMSRSATSQTGKPTPTAAIRRGWAGTASWELEQAKRWSIRRWPCSMNSLPRHPRIAAARHRLRNTRRAPVDNHLHLE